MEIDKRTLVLIFGLVGSILGFVVGVLFNSINYIMGWMFLISLMVHIVVTDLASGNHFEDKEELFIFI
ncbi:hypothetical protein YYE_02742 [Plasmodium vinckei vinckei]|nr:hypothetical protein YYE_02742 [Plasmodium vinckei vinckei]